MALDVGCGTGVDTVALAALVGPTGRVAGVADRVTYRRADATAL